jgi:hypothetical protein
MKNIKIYTKSTSIKLNGLKISFILFFVSLFLVSFSVNSHSSNCSLENCICEVETVTEDFDSKLMNFTVTYRVDVIPTWNSSSPAWPDAAAHFSWFGGANHNSDVKFWEVGTLASQGIDLLAVTGNTSDLVTEVQAEITNGDAENLINVQHWFCPDEITHPACGSLSFEIDVSEDFPLVTLASMLGPSPDWFVGVESLSMVDGDGLFIQEITYELYPYDAGILSDNSVLIGDCCDREPLSVPQENIHLITVASGETIGPNSLGQLVFTAITSTLSTETNEMSEVLMQVYPNPVSGNFHIQTELLDFKISMFDLKGSLLYTGLNQSLIDVSQFSNGIYLLEITDDKTNRKFRKKIVVE